ncbi:hypothetical protein B566_EDAN012278 [Ephemera danica]|nr:hypothetical protein B566_EDAN012278 [Ephemera danica]
MVSLVRSPQRSTAGGGFSFSTDGSINVDEDEIRTLQPMLGDESTIEFHPIRTIPVVLFQLTVTVAFGTTAIAIGFVWPSERERCEPFYLLLYMQACFYAITMAVHLYIRSCHHPIRVDGYLDFYLDIMFLYRLPAHITCLCCVLLMVVATVIHQTYRELEGACQQPRAHVFTPVTYLGVIVLAQTLIIAPCLVSYIVRVGRFNRVQPPPDVEREEWLASLLEETYRRPEIGFRLAESLFINP